MNIGRRLRELRQTKGMSQTALQRRSGFLRSYISHVERGRVVPSLRNLQRWAGALEVELHELFHGSGEKVRTYTDPDTICPGPQERTLLELFSAMDPPDRNLILSLLWGLIRKNAQEGAPPDGVKHNSVV
jgi:transcriptional regulator with XRE-family HTH domain